MDFIVIYTCNSLLLVSGKNVLLVIEIVLCTIYYLISQNSVTVLKKVDDYWYLYNREFTQNLLLTAHTTDDPIHFYQITRWEWYPQN